jgi:hypothetical protein
MAEIIYRIRAGIMYRSSQSYMIIASYGGSGRGAQEAYTDDYANSSTYKNRLKNILIKYPQGWLATLDGKILKIQNMEGDYGVLDAPSGMKRFWIDTGFVPGAVTKNELITNTAQYSGVKREVLSNKALINFYSYTDVDCGGSARAFWETADAKFYAHYPKKCGENISGADKDLFKKILESFEDF